MSVPLWGWLAVLGVILAMLAIDLFAHRDAHVIGVREAAIWSGIWVAFGVGFGALVFGAALILTASLPPIARDFAGPGTGPARRGGVAA